MSQWWHYKTAPRISLSYGAKEKDGNAQKTDLNGKKNKSKTFSCLGGDAGGPTYDGHDYDAYYYKNKEYTEKEEKEEKEKKEKKPSN